MQFFKRGALFAAALAIVVPASLAGAANDDLKLKPSAFSCPPGPGYDGFPGNGNGQNAQGQWTNKESETGKFSVLLEKTAPTNSCAGAAVVVKGVEGDTVASLGAIGFSVKGNCGGGSPRFNLLYDTNDDGQYDGFAFYGCANHPGGPGAKPGWVRMLDPDATTSDSGPVPPNAEVVQLYVIVDEQGTYYIDNVIAQGQTVGEPNGGS